MLRVRVTLGLSESNAGKEGPAPEKHLDFFAPPPPCSHAESRRSGTSPGPRDQGWIREQTGLGRFTVQVTVQLKVPAWCSRLLHPTLSFLVVFKFHAVSLNRCPTVNPTSPCCLCGQFSRHGPWLASASWEHLLELQLLGWSLAICIFGPSGDCLRSSVPVETAR